jgi:hypothetical protein
MAQDGAVDVARGGQVALLAGEGGARGKVLDASVRYLTAFFARLLLGDTSVGAAFAGAGIHADVADGVVTVESKQPVDLSSSRRQSRQPRQTGARTVAWVRGPRGRASLPVLHRSR